MLDVAGASQQLYEILVMGDDQQLEVTLTRATFNDSGESEQEEIEDMKLNKVRVFAG